MKISTLLGGMALLVSSYAQAQTYCQPTKTVPEWQHANSQSLYSIKVTSAGNTLLSYTDTRESEQSMAYNWLQDRISMTVEKGQELTMDVRSGIWSWDIQIGIDWDGDGTFEDVQRAFSTPGVAITEATSSWSSAYASTFANADWRKEQERTLGHRGVVYHQFTFTVPQTARAGNTRMRVICDGDGYGDGDGYNPGVPPFDMCGKVGYAGSMHDFGIKVADSAVTGLQGVSGDNTGERTAKIHTINGIKVSGALKDLPKGIYVVDGKKIVKP